MKDGNKKNVIQSSGRGVSVKLYRSCGKGNHNFARCQYKQYTGKICKEVGHLARVCSVKTNFVESEGDTEAESLDFIDMFYVNNTNYVNSVKLDVIINNKEILMELDSGVALSVLPEEPFLKKKFYDCVLQPTSVTFRCYDGSIIIPKGQTFVKIIYHNQVKEKGRLIIVKNG
ncbi:unnamed protein product [Ceutorhynchus assimilis]|uniref:Uncharacterized protein n=1 Tax=Ceutorhynchus assimilis TaxID=467358 RepID=A0A9N9MWR7_9CUCU|nr:unnamed protein product [Ceutorhynchus assimilis]